MGKPDKDNSDRVDCDICNVKDIHINDLNNHNNSRKHINKCRQSDSKQVPTETTIFRCETCNKELTDEGFFQIHLASKSHKKNVRKTKKLVVTKREESRSKFHVYSFQEHIEGIQTLETEAEQREEFCRKKYKTRSDHLAFEQIEPYVFCIVSYLSVKLAIDPFVTDFEISVNDKRYQSFGDIVIHVTRNEKCTNYAIRCKQTSTTSKSIENLKDAKIILEKEYKSIDVLSKQKNFGITKFLIFTTCSTTSNFPNEVDLKTPSGEVLKLNIVPSKKNDLINVSTESDNIFLLVPDESKDAKVTEKDLKVTKKDVKVTEKDVKVPKTEKDLKGAEVVKKKLPQLFLFTNQTVQKTKLDEFLKKRFANYPSINKEYNNYIENWANGILGGNYILNKKEVILKLGELLLDPYIILPKIVKFNYDNFEVWNNVINKIDVIIAQAEPFLLSKLCEPFNQMIENYLSVKFDSITKTVTVTEEILENVTDPQIKAYFFEEHQTLQSEIHLTKIYRVFWKAGKIPLLISLENNEEAKGFILDVISFMKAHGVRKKFLLKSEVEFQLFKKPPDNLKIFSCLNDVKEYVDLDKIKIKVTRDFSLTIAKISQNDQFFLKWITPSIFFDMVLDRYTMNKEKSPEFDIQGNLKIILDNETKNEVHKQLYDGKREEENLGRLKGVNPLLF